MNREAFYFDLLERAGFTALQAFAAAFIVDGMGVDLDWQAKVGLAGSAALVAAFKVLVASKLPWTASDSGSTLPVAVDPPSPEARAEALAPVALPAPEPALPPVPARKRPLRAKKGT